MSKQVTAAPSARSIRLDGGHPALDLVNTVYGQPGGPVEHDVLAEPRDLLTFARRIGLVGRAADSSGAALRAVRALRDALDEVLRAHLDGEPLPPAARATIEDAGRAATGAGRLARRGAALAWVWPARDAWTPVHRLALAALELLTDGEALARLRQCDGCRWLFLDHSRGPGRRWCSMVDCGTTAKKRRYVQRRRERRLRRPAPPGVQPGEPGEGARSL